MLNIKTIIWIESSLILMFIFGCKPRAGIIVNWGDSQEVVNSDGGCSSKVYYKRIDSTTIANNSIGLKFKIDSFSERETINILDPYTGKLTRNYSIDKGHSIIITYPNDSIRFQDTLSNSGLFQCVYLDKTYLIEKYADSNKNGKRIVYYSKEFGVLNDIDDAVELVLLDYCSKPDNLKLIKCLVKSCRMSEMKCEVSSVKKTYFVGDTIMAGIQIIGYQEEQAPNFYVGKPDYKYFEARNGFAHIYSTEGTPLPVLGDVNEVLKLVVRSGVGEMNIVNLEPGETLIEGVAEIKNDEGTFYFPFSKKFVVVE